MENLAEFREGVPFEFHPVANGIAEAVGGSCKDAFDRRECVRVEEVEYRKFCRAFREATELLAVGPGLDQVHRRDFARVIGVPGGGNLARINRDVVCLENLGAKSVTSCVEVHEFGAFFLGEQVGGQSFNVGLQLPAKLKFADKAGLAYNDAVAGFFGRCSGFGFGWFGHGLVRVECSAWWFGVAYAGESCADAGGVAVEVCKGGGVYEI